MPVILGNAGRPSFDASGAMLQNKQIETQKAIAREQIKAANQRSAMGMAENALGMLNANNQRAQDRQMQQQRDAQQRQEQQRNQRASRLQQLLAEIGKENAKWDQHVEQMRQRGFTHDQKQMGDLFAIDQQHNDLARKFNEEVKAGNIPAAEAIALEMLGTLQNRWIFQPKTEIPPKFEEIEGQKFIRDANGNLREIGNLQEKIRNDNQLHADRMAANKLRVVQEARDAFNDAYQTGGTFNDALDAKNEILTSNGLPPSPMARKTSGDPGYYFNDPKAGVAAQKKLDADEKYLRGRRDKIMDALRMTPDEEWKPGEKEAAFKKAWKEEGYEALEQRIQSERGGQTEQPGKQASVSDEIPQDVSEAKSFLDKVAAMRASGWKSPDPQRLLKDITAAKGMLKAYETQNPGKLSSLPAAPQQGQARPAAVGPAQGAGVPQQAPQGQPAAPAKPSGPFKGKIISSMGGGGMGGTLAMGPDLGTLASGVWDSVVGPAASGTNPESRSEALATGPDAESVAGGDELERMNGFLQRMEAWVQRNPMPVHGLYQPIKDGNSRDYTTGSLFKPTPRGQPESSAGPGLAVPSASGGPSAPAPKLAPFTATPKGPMGPMGPLGTFERGPLGAELSKPYGGSGYAPSGVKEAASTAGKLARAAGNLGTALTVAGWIGSLAQEPSQHINQAMVDWMTQRMTAENGLADAFGIPRDDARTLSARIDKYTKGVRSEHLAELRAKADKIVPPENAPETPVRDSYRPGKQKVEMDLSPFAFVNERDLRQKIWDEYERLWDKLPERWITEQQAKEEQDRLSGGGRVDPLSEKERLIKEAISDRSKMSWEQFKQNVSELAESWARANGYSGADAGSEARTQLQKFADAAPHVGDWSNRKFRQPDWSAPNGVTSSEWSSIQSNVRQNLSDGKYQSFFGSHVDKPGSYTRQGNDNERRYEPDASRQTSSENQIQISREPDGELKLTSGSGKEMYPSRGIVSPMSLRPDLRAGEAQYDRNNQPMSPKERAEWLAERDAVKVFGLSGTGEPPNIPDGANKDDVKAEQLEKTSELSQSLQQLADEGQLPFDVKQQYENYPAGVTKLPAAQWTGKDGKQHTRNDIPTSPAGIKGFIDEVSKDKGVGRHSEEWKQSEEQAKQEADQAKFQPRPLPEQVGIDHGSHLTPRAQEAHLRSPKAASRQEFGEAFKNQFGSEATDDDYQNYIDAREAVRSRMPKSADVTAPGNLFLDPKTGELKQSDGRKGRAVPDGEKLPGGYDQVVPLPKTAPLGQAPQQGPRQIGPMDIARGAAVAKQKMAAEAANSPRQRALDRLDQQQRDEARQFGQPRDFEAERQRRNAAQEKIRQEQQRLEQLRQQAEEMRNGLNDRIDQMKNNRVFPFPPDVSQNQYQPTFQDFSSQGMFPQSLNIGQRQPDYDNSFAMNSLGNTFWPQSELPNYTPRQYQPSYATPQYEQPQYDFQQSYQPPPDYFNPSFDFQPTYGGYQPYGTPGTGLNDFGIGPEAYINSDYIPQQEIYDYPTSDYSGYV